jgi:hypothetical protein
MPRPTFIAKIGEIAVQRIWSRLIIGMVVLIFSISIYLFVTQYRDRGVVSVVYLGVQEPTTDASMYDAIERALNKSANRDYLLESIAAKKYIENYQVVPFPVLGVLELTVKSSGLNDTETDSIIEKLIEKFNDFGPLREGYQEAIKNLNHLAMIQKDHLFGGDQKGHQFLVDYESFSKTQLKIRQTDPKIKLLTIKSYYRTPVTNNNHLSLAIGLVLIAAGIAGMVALRRSKVA